MFILEVVLKKRGKSTTVPLIIKVIAKYLLFSFHSNGFYF